MSDKPFRVHITNNGKTLNGASLKGVKLKNIEVDGAKVVAVLIPEALVEIDLDLSDEGAAPALDAPAQAEEKPPIEAEIVHQRTTPQAPEPKPEKAPRRPAAKKVPAARQVELERGRHVGIARLKLPAKLETRLRAHGIRNLGALLQLTPQELDDIPGITFEHVQSIRRMLAEKGEHLHGDEVPSLDLLDRDVKLVVKTGRALHGLRDRGITTVRRLIELSPRELVDITGVGEDSIGIIVGNLAELGLPSLKQSEPVPA